MVALRFLNSERTRHAFRFGRVAGRITGLRSANDIIDQLQAQLDAERKQHAFILAEKEKEIAILIRDLMRAQYELAQRNMVDAFRDTPSPSAMMH